MAILKTVFSLTVLQVVLNILGTEGCVHIPDYQSQETHDNAYVPKRQKREALQGYQEYVIDVELNVSSIAVLEQLKAVFNSVSLPIQIEDTNITDINISTVCSPVGSGYQCKCEEEFSWPLESCQKYSNCSTITANTCGCINAIPLDGPFCEINSATTQLTPNEYIIEVEVNVSDIAVLNQLKFLLDNVTFPFQLNPMIEITDILNITIDTTPTSTIPTTQLTPDEYIIEVEVNVSDIAVLNQLKFLLDNDPFPFKLNPMIEITDVNLTSVCSSCGCVNTFPLNGSFCPPVTTPPSTVATTTPQLTPDEYIIEVEVNVSDLLDNDPFPFQLNPMIEITDVNLTSVCSSCGCVNTFPLSGSFCPPVTTPPSTVATNTTPSLNVSTTQEPTTPQLTPVEYIIEVEVNVSDIAVLNQLKFLLDNFPFPYQLNPMIEITDVNLTSVCSSCGCVNTFPLSGSFCPPVTTPPSTVATNTTPASTVLTTQEPTTTTPPPNTTPASTVLTTQEPTTTTPPPTIATVPPNTTPASTVLTTQEPTTTTPPPTIATVPPNTTPASTVLTTQEPTIATAPRKTTPASTVRTTQEPTTTTAPPAITPAPPKFEFQMTFRIVNLDFDNRLSDTSSQQYIQLERVIRNAIDKDYKANIDGYVEVSSIHFSSGSVVTTYTVGTNIINSIDFKKANQALVETLAQNYSIAPESFNADPFQTENTFEGLDVLYSGDSSMTLRCNPENVNRSNSKITWFKDENRLENNVNNKYEIQSETLSLRVKNLIRSDSAKYECSVKDGILRFIRNQPITVEPAPRFFVEREVIRSQSDKVTFNCCGEARDFRLQWKSESGAILGEQPAFQKDLKCIQIDIMRNEEATQKFNCSMTFRSTTFLKEATVHFLRNDENFPCNDPYGPGKENDEVSIGCSMAISGSQAYRCENGIWTFVNSTCLLPAIMELEVESKSLDLENIVVFVSRVRNVTETSEDEVGVSTTNIVTIVDILTTVVDVIDGTEVNDTVIENFLIAVNVLVGNDTEGTWGLLNEDGDTNNTSSQLLASVEGIVQAIENTTISFTTSNIELNKEVFFGNFSITFNSTDNITVFESMPRFETTITTVLFRTLHFVLPARNLTSPNNTINGAVILAYTNSTVTNVTLTFNIRNTTLADPQCVFWNFSETAWDSSGCEVETDGNETITCFCNHLTSFSILMSPSIPEAFRLLLDFITYIGVGISLGSLVLCLIIEGIVWTVVTRNDISYMRHVTIVNIAVSLLIANIWFIIGAAISDIDEETPVGPCSAATFFIHFFYLALFFWMLISGLLLFYHMVMVFAHMSKRTMMAISFSVGYGAPLIIAVVTVAVTAPQNGYFRQNDVCWLNWFQTKALLAFVIPALAIVVINFLILIVVLYKLLRRGVGENQSDERNALVVIARCVALLTPFFGLTWGFGIGVMLAPESIGLHVVFAVLNSLQGFFVLVFGTLLDSRIRAALAGRFSFINTSSNRTRSTSGGPSSSSGLGLFRRHRRDVYHVSEAASSSQSTAATESFINT
ncbi:adhesion G protein-coupled receptor F5-like [Conger conger]|uniref:adhesion G protein-coupled receptor F5-like n=1 Tax=Conger conger TaxID=82655 RepID=UPI002A59B3BD|nr:adhesion G protein-coupled receptor F5-like [Conger conger]